MTDHAVEEKLTTRPITPILLVVIMAAAALVVLALAFSRPPASSETFDNGVTTYNPPRPVQDFTLTGTTNQPVSLSSFKGQMVMLFFGYTHCPDFCPMTLLEFKQIKQALGEKAADVRFVFVSVDGERDTPDKLRDYISRFDPDFFGLTGEEAILRRIAPDYNLQFEKVMGSAPDVYLVDHTATSFLLDRDGRLVNKFIFNIDPQIVADVIQARLAS